MTCTRNAGCALNCNNEKKGCEIMEMNLLQKARKKMHNDILLDLDNKDSIQQAMNRRIYCAIENSQMMLSAKDKEWENSYYYQFYSRIHSLLTVYDVTEAHEFSRIGGGGDGGYVMVEPFSSTHIAYSFGIGDDIAWEKDMAAKGYDVYMYDHTIEALPEDDGAFHWQKTGLSGDLNEKDGRLKPLKSLLVENGHLGEKGLLLKMDIEGYEWEVFETISEETLDCFDQIVVELHGLLDPALHKSIETALQRLTSAFKAVHVHANNGGEIDYCGDLVMPNLLEVTFVNRKTFELRSSKKVFPTEFDRPNVPLFPEVKLGIWSA